MDNSEPSTAIVPESLPQPKLPTVRIRARGHMQKAQIDKLFSLGQFHFQVSPGVKFDSNDVGFVLEEVVNDGSGDKVCATLVKFHQRRSET